MVKTQTLLLLLLMQEQEAEAEEGGDSNCRPRVLLSLLVSLHGMSLRWAVRLKVGSYSHSYLRLATILTQFILCSHIASSCRALQEQTTSSIGQPLLLAVAVAVAVTAATYLVGGRIGLCMRLAALCL
jgi:hypothetical protein